MLVPLYERGGELHAVFTKRRHDLRRHAGEISFPGGRQDPGEDLRQTALREAEEEIGLPPDAVVLAGALTPTATFVTSYAVYPFVGVIKPGHTWKPSPSEVAEVLELSLDALESRNGTYVAGNHVIWGATARILSELLQRLREGG